MNILKKKYTINYHPKTREELKVLVDNESICLGEIDISSVTDMSELFAISQRTDFAGLESWDVSHVTDMRCMFYKAVSFNHDISNWDDKNAPVCGIEKGDKKGVTISGGTKVGVKT